MEIQSCQQEANPPRPHPIWPTHVKGINKCWFDPFIYLSRETTGYCLKSGHNIPFCNLKKKWYFVVLRIRIRIRITRIYMFLGLPDPDPLVRYSEPDPSIIKQKEQEKH
jgi:hypothetical protein